MLQFGSFSKNSCHTLGAKHQPAIQDARATKSRKFIALIIAVKEQLRLANRLQCKKVLNCKFEVIGSELIVSTSLSRFVLPPSFQNQSTQHTAANVLGTTYKKGVCVVTDANDDDGPLLGIVSEVFVKAEERRVGLVCDLLTTTSFSHHFHA